MDPTNPSLFVRGVKSKTSFLAALKRPSSASDLSLHGVDDLHHWKLENSNFFLSFSYIRCASVKQINILGDYKI